MWALLRMGRHRATMGTSSIQECEMSRFPQIQNIQSFRAAVENENFLFRQHGPNIFGFYMVQGQETFSGDQSDLKREVRGISFDATSGKIVSRPLHKFFNVCEKSFTAPEVINWADVSRIMVKRDGSMVHPIPFNDTIRLKTKKTADSAEAIAATLFMNKNNEFVEWVRQTMHRGHTPIFEFTSPAFPIVVSYKSEELTLLHIRDNLTGQYFDLQEYSEEFGKIPFPIVEDVSYQFMQDGKVEWSKIKEWTETAINTEGVVIQFKDGEMMKAKTKWYTELHRSIVFIRIRDVVKVALSDQIDDLVAAFRMCGRPESTITQVLEIQKSVLDDVQKIKTYCEWVVSAIPLGTDRKTVYQEYANKSQYPSLVMNLWVGKNNDYIEFYRKNRVSDWPLDVIVDLSDD